MDILFFAIKINRNRAFSTQWDFFSSFVLLFTQLHFLAAWKKNLFGKFNKKKCLLNVK